MDARAKITSKGQITVPRSVRRALGVKEGDNLIFKETPDGFSITPVRNQSVFEKYRGVDSLGVGSGREAVIRAVRELRGNDDTE